MGMRERRTDVEITPLPGGVTRINEYDFVNCFLVEGSERACLIDAGAGVADVAAIVKTLTDKPVTVLITHAHADHVGGAVWFKEAYIHPADEKTGYFYMTWHQRLYFLHSHEYKRKSHSVSYGAAFQRNYRTKLKPITEGDAIDLGGRKIEVFFTPGHTKGGLSFRDTRTGALFTGDNVNPMVTLQFPFADTVRVWLQAAEKTLALAGDAPIYGGHGDGVINRADLETTVGWAKELVAAGNRKPNKTAVKRGNEKYPCIVYKTGQVE